MVHEIFPDNLNAHDKECIGCQRHDKSALICFSKDGQFYDIFLDEKQLDELINDLQFVKRHNQREIPDFVKIQK